QRRWLFVPLWGIRAHFCYAPRRVECAEHGVVVEHIPWSDGKRPVTCAMMGFLARWARRLSWRETTHAFQTSWEAVYRSVEWFVQWGLAHRALREVESIAREEARRRGRPRRGAVLRPQLTGGPGDQRGAGRGARTRDHAADRAALARDGAEVRAGGVGVQGKRAQFARAVSLR